MACTAFQCHDAERQKKVLDNRINSRGSFDTQVDDKVINRVDSRSARGFSLEEHVNRVLQAQEKFMEQQREILQTHLETFMTEQAGLRTVMERQHQQIMHAFETHNYVRNGFDSSTDQTALLASEVSPAPPQVSPPSSGRKDRIQQVNRMDLAALPHDWPTTTHRATTQIFENDRRCFHVAKRFVRGPIFDILMCGVILINIVIMIIQIQWKSYFLGTLLGRQESDHGWQENKIIFDNIEFVFCTVYLVEFIIRFYLLRWGYFRHWINRIDFFIVMATCVETYVLRPTGLIQENSKISLARLLRLVRVARILKVVRFAESCSDLRVMLRTLLASARSLAWSMLLISAIIVVSGILLFQFLTSYVEDESNPQDTREWVYDHFGGSLLSTMVMFEATFSTAWVGYSERLIKEVSPLLSFFWVFYVVMVNFAVMRVISALFLKETMAVAAVDAEKMAMARMKEKQKFAAEIKEIFIEADASGDGTISVKEFVSMVHNPDIGEKFEQLQLEVIEVATLFQLLASDDGVADYEEFLEGALKLKNSARTIDIIQILHEHMKLMKVVEDMGMLVDNIATATGAKISQRRPILSNGGGCV